MKRIIRFFLAGILLSSALIGTNAVFAQDDELYYHEGSPEIKASCEYYKDINHWDIFVEPYTIEIIDTVYDDYGIKHGYFLNGYYFAAVPHPSEYIKPNIVTGRRSTWKKIPIEGKNNVLFERIRKTILPFSSNYATSTSSETIFADYTNDDFENKMNELYNTLTHWFQNNYLYYCSFHLSNTTHSNDIFDFTILSNHNEPNWIEYLPFHTPNYDKRAYLNSILTNDKQKIKQIKRNMFVVDKYVISVAEHECSYYSTGQQGNILNYKCDDDNALIFNADYAILDSNTICCFHNQYSCYYDGEGDEDGWGVSLISHTTPIIDSLLHFENNSVNKIKYQNYTIDSKGQIHFIISDKDTLTYLLEKGQIISDYSNFLYEETSENNDSFNYPIKQDNKELRIERKLAKCHKNHTRKRVKLLKKLYSNYSEDFFIW